MTECVSADFVMDQSFRCFFGLVLCKLMNVGVGVFCEKALVKVARS